MKRDLLKLPDDLEGNLRALLNTPPPPYGTPGSRKAATLIPYRGKPAKDGPRYNALGNSMAVPCMAWIGRRIAAVNALRGDRETPAVTVAPLESE